MKDKILTIDVGTGSTRAALLRVDGTMVGFVFGHTARYRAAEDFGYNLYRLNPDGTAVFLNAGCKRGGAELYVQDGKAHWTVNGEAFSASI